MNFKIMEKAGGILWDSRQYVLCLREFFYFTTEHHFILHTEDEAVHEMEKGDHR